jgi:hypothetical protein
VGFEKKQFRVDVDNDVHVFQRNTMTMGAHQQFILRFPWEDFIPVYSLHLEGHLGQFVRKLHLKLKRA